MYVLMYVVQVFIIGFISVLFVERLSMDKYGKSRKFQLRGFFSGLIVMGIGMTVFVSLSEPPVDVIDAPNQFTYRDTTMPEDPILEKSVTMRGMGFEIAWESEHREGATASGVLQATQRHLNDLQSTPKGGDHIAKAIFAVAEALDHLDGTDHVTAVPLTDSDGESL